MLYPTLSKQETFEALHTYSKLRKTVRNNMIILHYAFFESFLSKYPELVCVNTVIPESP